MSEQRFDRIENTLENLIVKMDKLSELMSSVIRMEEKQIAVQARLDNIDTRINIHGVTLDNHSVKIATITKSSGANEWFVRVLIAALVTGVVIMLRG
tara:strand:+ start:117 stop:407 length:291 start_codon:yes stop_codon:yes gene_type:complete